MLFISLVLCCIGINAQMHRFVYQYEFTKDSTNKEMKKEIMYLDIQKDKSHFLSSAMLVQDSIYLTTLMEELKKGDVNLSRLNYENNKINVFDVITKNHSSGETTWETNVLDYGTLLVSEKPKFDWKLTSETQTIENYPCQKATLDYMGRKWVAWFSTELPFPNGPYKFSGLPGLIVKMEDLQKTHIFTLKGNHKLKPEECTWDKIIEMKQMTRYPKYLKVNGKLYRKIWINHRKDPTSKQIQDLQRYKEDYTPSEYQAELEYIKERGTGVKKQLESQNNFLEPQLHN